MKRHPLATATLTPGYQGTDNIAYLAAVFYDHPESTISSVDYPHEWTADEQRYYRQQLAAAWAHLAAAIR